MIADELDKMRKVAYLNGVMAVLIDEMDRIYQPGRFILLTMLDHKRGARLLYQADAVVAEIARLTGEPHTPLPPLWPRRRARLPGHPMLWVGGQWFFGIFNAWRMVESLMIARWWLAALSASGIVAALLWNVPPLRLAIQGKYNDEP